MDRDSLFVIDRGDGTTIELMVDDTCDRNKIEYLPVEFLNKGIVIEKSYEGSIPMGLPLADTLKITLDAFAIDAEQAKIGQWIKENSSPNNKKPNAWIVKENGNIIFSGIQQPEKQEKYDLIKGEVQIQAVGMFKTILEAVRIDTVMSASPVDNDLIRGEDNKVDIYDYFNTSMLSIIRTRNGRIKFKKFWEFINLCFGEVETKYQYYMRNYNLTCTYTWTTKPRFYQNIITQNPTTLPEVEPYIISHIFHNNDNAITPATGAIPELQNRYKQLWNFFDELLKGWGSYAKINYSGSNIEFDIYTVDSPAGYADLGFPEGIITEEDLTSEKREVAVTNLNIRISNTRITKARDEDIKIITKNINSTSITGTTTEASCIFSNEPNTVGSHAAGSPKVGTTEFDIKKGEKPPVFGFYYKPEGDAYPTRRVSDIGSIGNIYNYDLDYSFLGIDGRDNYNSEIKKLQAKCLAGACQDIRDKYLSSAKIQDVITLSISKEKLNLSNVGDKYNLNISNVYNSTPFYQYVEFGESGMLGKMVNNLQNDYIECDFYYQGTL